MKVISLINQKGGVAKTGTAIELISFLTQFKKKDGSTPRVLAIDLDAQRHLGKFCSSDIVLEQLNRNGKYVELPNILKVLNAEVDIEEAIQHVELPKFLNKVAVSQKIADLRAEISEQKKQIRKEYTDKEVSAMKCRGLDAKNKPIINSIKKEIIEEEVENPGFDIIIGSQRLSAASKIFTETDDIYLLDTLLSILKDDYDYVVIDSAPGRSPLMNMSIISSDIVIIPEELDDGAIEGVTQTINDINNLKKFGAKAIPYLFRVKVKTNIIHDIINEELNELAQEYNVKILDSYTNYSDVSKECRKIRTCSGDYKPNSSYAFEHYKFTKEIINILKEE